MRDLNLVFLGLGGIGKTCALITFTSGKFPEEYVPTVFDNYSMNFTVDGSEVQLGLWDTHSRSEDGYRLVALSFPKTDVFFLGYAVNSQRSFDYLKSMFFPLLLGTHPDLYAKTSYESVPKFVVGLKSDLRDQPDVECIPRETGQALATEYGAGYLEFSALTGKGLKEALETGVRACQPRQKKESKRSRCLIL